MVNIGVFSDLSNLVFQIFSIIIFIILFHTFSMGGKTCAQPTLKRMVGFFVCVVALSAFNGIYTRSSFCALKENVAPRAGLLLPVCHKFLWISLTL